METASARCLDEHTVDHRYEPLRSHEGRLWDDYLARRGGSLCHDRRWGSLIESLFGHETHYWLARDGHGVPVGLLPLVRLRSRLFGDYLVSMPYLNYGGALGDSPEIEAGLMRAAAQRAHALGSRHIEFRDVAPRGGEWPVRKDKVAMLLELPGDPETLWKALGSKLRAQVRRPLKEGAQAAHGGAELLDEFYAVFSRNMRDLGTPVYPRRFFAAIAELFAAELEIVVVRLGGRAVAAGFLLGHGGRLEIPWASSRAEFNRLGVNMLLYWRALERAVERGYAVFDFGRSSLGAGTYRFKKQWGARPMQLYWHYWLRDGGRLPDLTPDSPRYRLAVRAWRKLPLPLANRLGPGIVKNLP